MGCVPHLGLYAGDNDNGSAILVGHEMGSMAIWEQIEQPKNMRVAKRFSLGTGAAPFGL